MDTLRVSAGPRAGGTAWPHKVPLLGVTATGLSVFCHGEQPAHRLGVSHDNTCERQKGNQDGVPGLCEPTKLLLTLTPPTVGQGPDQLQPGDVPSEFPWPGCAVGLAVGMGLRLFSSTGQVQCGQVHCRLPYTAPPVHLKADMEGPLSNRGEKVILVLAACLGPTSSCSFCVIQCHRWLL